VRTTITLDEDVAALVKRAMRDRGISFKHAVNDAIRAGLAPGSPAPFQQRTFSMGYRPEINYDRALQLADALEDQELLHKLALRK
jgi:hypothetical protein